MSIAVLIPARINSSRFPNKMLAPLNGKPLIRHVYDKCAESHLDVYVVTDSYQIAELVPNAIITTGWHENGTSRCAEASQQLRQYTRFVNVQGDMPDITSDIIWKVAGVLSGGLFNISTAFTQMPIDKQLDPNTVKLIRTNDKANWFLRAAVPYGEHHLGVYGYTRFALDRYPSLFRYKEEDIEQLEQLRWIQNNIDIGVTEVKFDGIEINTLADLEEWHRKNA